MVPSLAPPLKFVPFINEYHPWATAPLCCFWINPEFELYIICLYIVGDDNFTLYFEELNWDPLGHPEVFEITSMHWVLPDSSTKAGSADAKSTGGLGSASVDFLIACEHWPLTPTRPRDLLLTHFSHSNNRFIHGLFHLSHSINLRHRQMPHVFRAAHLCLWNDEHLIRWLP